MMTNLFSMFDPVGISLFSGVWVIWLSVMLLLVSSPTLILSGPLSMLSVMLCFMKSEVDSLVGSHSYLSPVLIGVFISTLMLNSIGLIPYALTITSFMPHNLSLAFSLWMGPVMFSISQSLNSWLAHLLPLGTPVPLMPLMVMIESISIVIRPLTLSVRLLANMLAGHLLLSLVGSALSLNVLGSLVILAQTSLVVLELAVAFLQSVVFMTLITLYSKE